MASIVANLPPPLLVHGRKTIFRNLQKLPVSSFRETQNHVTVLVKATGESSESSTSLSIVKSVQSFAVDKLPLIPSFLELIGILFSSWFIYRYLLFKPDREELFQLVKKSISDILGQ
ncbi:hypothetical protein I3843_01G227500 [Carya illinoinensis]|uniref:Cyanobacterial aminoacyl-tRNA synthetase CAAD domain-containing protein n=1 Tax=Carya illinoinensis TaxID=32201 RepID=A0A922GAR9_CARIL|nr:hypothetical protein I3842_01G236900 [Carya illinoinensis]KAG7997795.1 hypothetical protein I3843_01G227500 [Carya illinoinensis]